MPAARRTAAALAAVLATAGCTGDERPDDGEPAPQQTVTEVLGTVDLDAAVGGNVVLFDLAAGPDGSPVALLGADGNPQSWLVRLTSGDAGPAATDVRSIPPVDAHARLAVTDDGTVLVAGAELLRLPPGVAQPTATPWDLGGIPTAVVLTSDGRTLYAARDTRVAAVDVATGAARGTGTTSAPVTHLAVTPDDGLAALVAAERPAGGTGAVLVFLDRDLRSAGDPVELVPERGSTPTALQVTADGTAVATVHLGEARSSGRLVTVVDGAVETTADVDGAGDSALDLAVDPTGRLGHVPLADLEFPAELVTVDLITGEQVGAVKLCAGAGVFGAVAPLGDGGSVVVTGACIDGDGPQSTAFVVG
ncbi:YncE family protein [Geodermatophilus sp. CPCC 205761]|uniref:YncE family protein n=1 Tax=Geodermatophilus sp. CPCC 205761 TaxID=2936597 RepID=UPI003EEAD1C3